MALTILLIAFALIALRHGWIIDDAYITVRTVDNFFAGHGLVWNVGERVQAYTHPLWMMLLCAVYAITDEFFFSLIVLGVTLSTLALALVGFRLARNEWIGLALVVLATLSHAFVDYSTAGLENPLTHLLFACAAWVHFGRLPSAKSFGLLCLIGGLAILCRPDNAVLLAPVVVAGGIEAWRRGSTIKALLEAAALAAIPLLGWELFSLFYYGLLVPNTALAKLNTGIPKHELITQGFFYFIATLDADPLTLLLILAGLVVPFATRDRRTMPLAIGIGLHLLYVLSIGGDFMLGRFLTSPMFMALIVLSQLRGLEPTRIAATTAVLAALGLATTPSTLELNTVTSPEPKAARTLRRITDERALFSDDATLLAAYRTRDMPHHKWRWMGERGVPSGKKTAIGIAMGFRGYGAGPDIHLIDKAALTDPLLARLPATYNARWMSGHFLRAVPPGYVETIETGENKIQDEKVAMLYDRLRVVISGPLWSRERLAAIWWLNTGGPAKLVNEEKYRYYGSLRLKPHALTKLVPDGAPLTSKRLHKVPTVGAHMKWPEPQHPATIHISLNDRDKFELVFYDENQEIGRALVPRELKWGKEGMSARTVEVPAEVQERGFTRLRVLPLTEERQAKPLWLLGHLVFDHVEPEPDSAPVAAPPERKGAKQRADRQRRKDPAPADVPGQPGHQSN